MNISVKDFQNHLMTFPQSPVIEVGSDFMSTCVILDTAEVTSDDLYWNLSDTTLPRELYTRINSSALSVTFTVNSEKPEWLYCLCRKPSPYVVLNQGRFIHGLYLRKGYGVQKPANLTCVALQEKTYISETISCKWDDRGRQTKEVPTTYTLYVKQMTGEINQTITPRTNGQVTLGSYPTHTPLEIWVEAKNLLGVAESDRLIQDAGFFVKTNPPSNVTLLPEPSITPTSLLLKWTPPIDRVYVRLTYRIRFCVQGAHTWSYVPDGDLSKDIESFRLQGLQPDTVYLSQVSCKNARPGHGHWSEWSNNATMRTPEDRPPSKPDLWMISERDHMGQRKVRFISKKPVFANGRILHYYVKVYNHGSKNSSSFVSFNASESRGVTVLNHVLLSDQMTARIWVSAVNSVGRSPEAYLGIPERNRERPPVEELRVWPHEGRLMVEWQPLNSSGVTEFVVEWVRGPQKDWQRETKATTRTHITGNLEEFECYTVSVYSIYSGWISRPASVDVYLKQRAPSVAPTVNLVGVPGRNKAHLRWTEVSPEDRGGFITNYTVYYKTGEELKAVTLHGNSTSCTLTSLLPDTTYVTWITASTVAGSTNGSRHSFTTAKYDPGEIKLIVVSVSLGFLFVFMMTALLCFNKKDAIKENFWPRIPNPGESTIGNWSSDYSQKAEPPGEDCLSGISERDVDVCDGCSLLDEEKVGLPLKKVKFLPEEHSSGIRGSSCMFSPRQSVSDSNEGGDMAETTASTVQSSSVVASNRYKGQTPIQTLASLFSCSKSTHALLDSEENPDITLQDGSRQSLRCGRPVGGDHGPRLQREELQPLDFCPLQEDSENNTPADDQSAASASSYMPQLGGYRPQA
ncbi:interleukin-6 receptor subunit beta-like [Cheilinus undulatus]|uniref:interleukin-6 receptor subunit beta-like n=1 Tax=Cheilinus undulatus TaxID=241271 RepID=UPI001BD3BB8A|nr:interleukin-6 receptor subunit beta-like [Cheilinus undulatus]